jgi:hypothetical protein
MSIYASPRPDERGKFCLIHCTYGMVTGLLSSIPPQILPKHSGRNLFRFQSPFHKYKSRQSLT